MVDIPQPEEIIAEAVSLVRPGGSVAFHEADWAIHICDPPQQAWDRAGDLLIAYAQSAGIDLFVGRKMPRLLRAAGLVDVHAHPLIHMYPPGHARRPILLDFVNDVSDRMVETGIASVTELAELTDSLRRHLDDPDTLVVSHLFVQAWGRKPDAGPTTGIATGG